MHTIQVDKLIRTLCVCSALILVIGHFSHAQESVLAPSETGPQQQTGAAPDVPDDFSVALRPWKGDYYGMLQRRMVRIVVPYSMTHYFQDGATERGVVAAAGREFEREINRMEGLRSRLVHVLFIPVPRSQLIAYLTAGLGDIAAGSITITESLRERVDFSNPVFRNSKELIVTGPGAPEIVKMEDLAGQEVFVQKSASYYGSLRKLNQAFKGKGLPPIKIELVDELLEPDEILEMVGTGLIPITVVDRHLADFWGQVFPDLTVHSNLAVATGRDIAWAFRKDSPKLEAVLNEFLRSHRHRTKFGNIIFRRYLQNSNWARNATATRDRERFDTALPFFNKYGDEYNLDPLLLAALGYQESRLDQNTVSPAGAIGVMQLLSSTGASLNVGDITQLEPNIHGGTRYLRSLVDRIESPEVDRLNTIFLALASYNAGQTRIRRLRRETEQKGLDPNVWLNNVELAVAREIGRETVQYVRNIYKYFLAYRRVEAKRAQRGARPAD